jgi:hypothetical protein
MSWKRWLAYFDGNASRALPALAGARTGLPPATAARLARSLAVFYLGEAGEGRIAHEIDDARWPEIDADYRAALKRFVAEEGRHARILAALVVSLGGRLAASTWSERLFRRGRRLLGLRLKLLVLLAAEVISLGFYAAMARRLPRGAVRGALEHILDDERMHLLFHAEFFRRLCRTRLRRALFLVTWYPVATAAWLTVLIDHRRTLRTLGASVGEVARELAAIVARVARSTRRRMPACRGLLDPLLPAHVRVAVVGRGDEVLLHRAL